MASSARAIVIGTGAGGLATAAHLARDGFQVLALEASPEFGGALAPLEREEFVFDPGLQAMGECRPGQGLHTFFDELDIDIDELFVELDPDGFEILRFPTLQFKLCAGSERLRSRLEAAFPDERDGIGEFFELLGRIRALRAINESWQQAPPDFDSIVDTMQRLDLLPWLRTEAAELFDWVTDDPRLQAVLAAPAARWGSPPTRCGALHALRVFAHFADGAFYPRGGGGRVRDVLLETARRHGARFEANTEVTDILVEDDRAVAVRTDFGETFKADVVVSNVAPTLLYDDLLPDDRIPDELNRKVELTRPSLAPFQLLLGLTGNLEKRGLGAFDVSIYPSADFDSVYQPFFDGRFGDEHPLFISSTTSKSPDSGLAPTGRSTLQISTYAPYEMFATRWGETGVSKTSYRHFRQMMADEILVETEAKLPGLVDNVDVSEVITPLTHAQWNHAVEGASFGPLPDPNRAMLFNFGSTTPVSNVYLAGSGALGPGLGAALRSGRLAAKLAARRLTPRRTPPPTRRQVRPDTSSRER